MANYTLPPRSKASDYIKGKLTQDEIIALQVANDANISSARKAVKMGEVQQLTPLQSLSPAELLADDASQEASARSNLERLGFRPQEAAEVITIETINCETKKDALIRERYWIENLEANLNSRSSFKRFKNDSDRSKEWRLNNGEVICSCNSVVSRSNLSRHLKTPKHLNNIK